MPSAAQLYRRRRGRGFASLYRAATDSPTVAGSSVSTLVSDSFDRADNASSLGSTDTGQAWTANSGTWGIGSNRAVPPNAASANATVDAGALAVTVSLTCIPPASGNIDVAIIARYVDANNYIFLDVSKSGSVQVSRTFSRVGGANTGITSLINPAVADITSTFTMKLVFTSASAGESFVNGVSMGTFSGLNAALQTPTKYGMWCNSAGGCRFDTFTVTSP